MPWNFFNLFPGDPGITQTVNAIKQAVNYGIHCHEIRCRAETIVASCAERDEDCEIRTIFTWTQNHYRYLRDPRGIEYVKSPEISDAEISKTGSFSGDCDDIVTYMGALLKSIGYPVRAVVISVPGKGDEFRHIFLRVYKSQARKWVTLECTSRTKPIGWQAPSVREREYDL